MDWLRRLIDRLTGADVDRAIEREFEQIYFEVCMRGRKR